MYIDNLYVDFDFGSYKLCLCVCECIYTNICIEKVHSGCLRKRKSLDTSKIYRVKISKQSAGLRNVCSISKNHSHKTSGVIFDTIFSAKQFRQMLQK